MWRPRFVHIPTTPHVSFSPTPRDHESHIFSPWGPHQIPETTKNTPNMVTIFLALFQIVKIMLRWPQLIPLSTPPHECISPILRDAGSHIWGPWGPYQSLEATQNNPNTATFFLGWFWMVKIMSPPPKFKLIHTTSSWAISPIPRDLESPIWDPWSPYQSPESTQNTPKQLNFP